jgi:hypothetical protein
MFMTQTQTPPKQNPFAALDKKVADGIAADKAATQNQTQTTPKPQGAPAPAAKR